MAETMRELPVDDVLARRFLLGQLPPEEEGRIEELAFEDPGTFMFLESVEDDLIDDFIHGDLSADEEKRFQSHFLTLPGSRNNFKVSELLHRHLDSLPVAPDSKRYSFAGWFPFPGWFGLQSVWLKVSMVAAVTLVLVLFILWIITLFSQASKPAFIQAGQDRPTAVPSPLFNVSPSVAPTTSPAHVENKPKSLTPEKHKKLPTYALLLPSASPRGEGVQQLTVPAKSLNLTIELALITRKNFTEYEAALENEAGTVLQRWSKLQAEHLTSGKALKIDVPTALLKPQEFYRIVATGVSKGEKEVVARYPFEVKE